MSRVRLLLSEAWSSITANVSTTFAAVVTVLNRVVIAPREGAADYRASTLEITAPEGPHAWLNRLAFVGTLHPLAPRPAVLVRVFALVP